jgi:hypothetical protein
MRRQEVAFDLWLVVVTVLFFLATVVFALGCERLMGTK